MDFSNEDLGTNYKSLVKSVRRDANDIYSRLRSIDEDAGFVRRVKEANPTLPLVGEQFQFSSLMPELTLHLLAANLRCGAWYVDPSLVSWSSAFRTNEEVEAHLFLLPSLALLPLPKAHPETPAYFKSTDGHESESPVFGSSLCGCQSSRTLCHPRSMGVQPSSVEPSPSFRHFRTWRVRRHPGRIFLPSSVTSDLSVLICFILSIILVDSTRRGKVSSLSPSPSAFSLPKQI